HSPLPEIYPLSLHDALPISKLFYALRMPSFARERVKVLTKFTGIPEALAATFDADPKGIGAKFHRIEHHQAHLASSFFVSPFERDRKSTRLNSSHGSISYAV